MTDVPICAIPNCGRRALSDDAFCREHADARPRLAANAKALWKVIDAANAVLAAGDLEPEVSRAELAEAVAALERLAWLMERAAR